MKAISRAIDPSVGKSYCMTRDDIRLLAAIGFMVARMGLTHSAIQIFHGLSVLRPEADFPQMGMVMAYLAKGDSQTALRIVSKFEGENFQMGIEIRALQALALYLSDRKTEAVRLVNAISNDPSFFEENYPLANKVAALFLESEKDHERYLS